jgi:Family of unknown function (DUF6314)
MKIPDTFGFLLGTWELTREYTGHLGGDSGSFEGQAVLTLTEPNEAGLDRADYEETGQLLLGSYQGPARRRLEYRRGPGGAVLLYRPGGQPFIELDLSSGGWQATHPCGPDHYEIRHVIRSPDVVQEYWRVRGPDKDYAAVATLTRAS